jgi:cytochrome P450
MSVVALPDDLLTPDCVADPYPALARLREEDAVHFSEAHAGWLVTRYEDVWSALRSEALSSDRVRPFVSERLEGDRRTLLEPVFEVLSRWMVFMDPPAHTRLRKLVQRAFSPRAIAALRPRMQAIVDGLLDGLEGRGQLDLLAEFAAPLPATVIAELLGAPPQDRARFKAWSDDITPLLFAGTGVPDRDERASAGVAEFTAYIGELIAARRAQPGDTLLDSLLGTGDGGGELTDEEIVATCLLLLFAGHETTTNLIASGTLALLREPEQRARLAADPELIEPAVEEMLRFDGPAKAVARIAAADHELHGRRIGRGDRVFLMPSAANRDPDRFDEPDRLDVARRDNRHLGFGHGIHFCLGAALARAEGQVAIGTLLRRFPELHLAGAELEWHPTLLSRGLVRLPVALG